MLRLIRAFQNSYRAVFGPREHALTVHTHISSVLSEPAYPHGSQKRKAPKWLGEESQASKRVRSHDRGTSESPEWAMVPSKWSDDRSVTPESLNDPISTSGRQVKIVAVAAGEVSMHAILLDGTFRTLLRTVVEAERDADARLLEADALKSQLASFRIYAKDEIKQLERGERIHRRSGDESELAKAFDARRDLQEILEAADVEEKNAQYLVELAEWAVRKRHMQAFQPLEDALVRKGLTKPEDSLSESQVQRSRFVIPAAVDRYKLPTQENDGRRGSSYRPMPPYEINVPAYGESELPYGEVPRGCTVNNGEREVDYQRWDCLPIETGYSFGDGARASMTETALQEVRRSRKELNDAQRAWDKRSRETGADYFLRHKASSRALKYDSPLDFDIRQFKENNALTSQIATAETRLAEAIAAAHALNVDITTPSQTSNFNDPDGDTDPQRKLSGIHYAALGVRTEHLDQWLGSLPATVTHEGPLTGPQPEKPELDTWAAVPVGNYDSSSVVDDGKRKARIEEEKHAGEVKRVDAMDEWGGRYPRRRRETFDRWHANRRGGSL